MGYRARAYDLKKTGIPASRYVGIAESGRRGEYFYFKNTFGDTRRASPASRSRKVTVPSLQKKVKAILIDDDESVLSLTSEVLRQQSCKVKGFSKASEALPYIRANEYDIILTDIQMPEMNGFTFLEALRNEENFQKSEKPVVAITGRADLNAEEYTKAGFSAVIQKPFAPGALIKLISDLLEDYDPDTGNLQATLPVAQAPDDGALYNLETEEAFAKRRGIP